MIYSTSADNSSRFLLGEKGTNPLVVVGINPSTATDKEFDQTIKKIRGFSERKGFDGWLMINLYPQRTTDPRGLYANLSSEQHRSNIKHIKSALTKYGITQPTIWAAWGGEVLRREYLFHRRPERDGRPELHPEPARPPRGGKADVADRQGPDAVAGIARNIKATGDSR